MPCGGLKRSFKTEKSCPITVGEMIAPKLWSRFRKLASLPQQGETKIGKNNFYTNFREPVVTEDQQKEMMARAYRRQEELKKLAENNDDDYMHSPWADSGALKRSLTGMGNIKFGPR